MVQFDISCIFISAKSVEIDIPSNQISLNVFLTLENDSGAHLSLVGVLEPFWLWSA